MSTLFDSTDNDIRAAQSRLLESLRVRSRIVIQTDEKVLWRAVANQHERREAAEREQAIHAAAAELAASWGQVAA